MIRPLVCVLILAGQIHASAGPCLAQAATRTLPEYIAELDRLAAFLRTASADEAGALGPSLAPRWMVDTGTERVAVDTSWLVAELRQARGRGDEWSQARDRLRRRLLAMRQHAAALRTTDPPAALHATMRGAVQSVLARPEFRRSAGASWRERLQQWIGEWLESLLARIGVGDLGGRRIAVMFAWIAGLAALGGLGIWLARTLAADSRAVSIGISAGQRQRLSGREWALRAMAALRAGDAREAVRCAYNGALRRLEDDGVWRVDQARTPREYLRMLPAGDTRVPAVRELTMLFEQVWYGSRAIDRAAADRVGVSLESLGCLYPADRAI